MKDIDLTFIIQGPIDIISVNTIDSYLKYGKVIVSTWDNDSLTEKHRKSKEPEASGHMMLPERYDLLEPYLDRIKVVKSKYPPWEEKTADDLSSPMGPGGRGRAAQGKLDTSFFTCKTTLAGLEIADTEFSVKVRSDHSLPNIDPILKKVKEFPNKIYTLNCNAYKDRAMKFNMGDHFLLGKTEILKEAFRYRYMIENCGGQRHEHFPIIRLFDANGDPAWKGTRYGALLGTMCILIALGEVPDLQKSAEQVKKHFDITAIRDLEGYIWSQQGSNPNNAKAYKDRSIMPSSDGKSTWPRGITHDKNYDLDNIANHIDEV
jgi:hypothetical protein